MLRYAFVVVSVFLAMPLVAAEPADSVFLNGKIYTVDQQRPWAEAVAITKRRFVFVGSNEEARQFIGPSTQVSDLHGRMVMPGIHDAHNHMIMGGGQLKFGCSLPSGSFGKNQEKLIARLRECATRLEPGQWLMAVSFLSEQFPNGKPDREFIDRAFPDRPVLLTEYTHHNALANAKALQAVGITERIADPVGGKYVRDPKGRLTGELIEMALSDFRSKIPPEPASQVLEALRMAIETCNRFGITSLQEAGTNRPLLTGLKTLEGSGELTVNVHAHLLSHRALDNPEAANEALIHDRAQFASAHVNVNNIKMYLDGTPTPPYFTAANFDPATHQADLKFILVPPAELKEALRRFDSMGMKVKMHASGAGAAHVALDAIEYARKANPDSTIRHEVAHTNLIIPEDMDRMKALNAVAELSPAVWDVYGEHLGNPPQKAWQFRTLSTKGMLMTMGTDWGVMELPNFFPAIEGALEHGDESIDLDLALKMLTLNGATATSAEDVRGSIAAGKWATFIVLDRNLFTIPRSEIKGTRVLQTIFEGRTVYEATGS